MNKPTRLLVLFALFASFLGWGQPPAFASTTWKLKVDSSLLESTGSPLEFILFLDKQADLSAAKGFTSKEQKGAYVYQELSQTAERSQQALLEALQRSGAEYRSYWIANMIWVRGDPALLESFANRKDVARIYANPQVKMDLPEPEPANLASPDIVDEEGWIFENILKVRADKVWALGYTGQGVVVGGQDTGYYWEHPALKDKYRGWDGLNADHNYSWHDAIHEDTDDPPDGNPCGFDSSFPCDDQYHGTHTMGTMVGDDGIYQVGMAPGARWIGCRNMEDGWGTPTTYAECYQWFVAPTDLEGQNARPDLAPDVINNSWSCPPNEGCNWDSLITIVQNVRAAGIVTVHSAGNSGPYCSTVNAPGGIYDESFTVGNTDLYDVIASTSSRGPVTVDGSNRLKPDVSAPGQNIRSSVPYVYSTSGYEYASGTSMAAPHVAGLVALVLSARPDLRGQPDLIESLITGSAIPRTTTQECGGIPGSSIPNNTYGWGRVDALNAVEKAFNLHFIFVPIIVVSP